MILKGIFSVLAGLVPTVGLAIGPAPDCRCVTLFNEAKTKLKAVERDGKIDKVKMRQANDLMIKGINLHQQGRHHEAITNLEKALTLLEAAQKRRPPR